MTTFKLEVNGKNVSVDADEDTPLLWVLRDNLQMTGTKYGCGIGQCGACTVHMDGQPVRSCSLPINALQGRKITTIEGISPEGDHPIQKAWVDLNVPQCGYCQPGQIMSATALLANNKNPSDEDINSFMSGNICRCGTYQRIKKGIKMAAEQMGGQ